MVAQPDFQTSSQLNSPEILKLVDFGLAREGDGSSISLLGGIAGTPAYMAPEQARGQQIDSRADIFALGILLFEAITGHNPLYRDSLVATLAEVTADKPVDLSPLAGKAPPAVIDLIERAVAKERDRRYPTCEALLADLDGCLDASASPSITQLASSPPSEIPAPGPALRTSGNIPLTAEVTTVLRAMFRKSRQIAVEAEFGRGQSGSRVFQVHPVEADGQPRLPVVVKVAPMALIQQERWAYQTWVKDKISHVVHLQVETAAPPDSAWDGLRYELAGGGIFKMQSLGDYARQASASDLHWVLAERLFAILGENWWLVVKAVHSTFQMQIDYDSLLPVNLLLRPGLAPVGTELYEIKPDELLPLALTQGQHVRLHGFVVTEVDLAQRQVTLNWPSEEDGLPSASYRLRLVELSDVERYRVGHVIDVLQAEIVATRHDLLVDQVRRVLDQPIDFGAEQLKLPFHPVLSSPSLLPNPLLAYPKILQASRRVKISTIHGDLNMENVLIDPMTQEVWLIDFAAVRQGHALHDLLHLETAIVTKLVPPALTEAGLPPYTIWSLYDHLHQAVANSSPPAGVPWPNPSLEKALAMLSAIRGMARDCLFNPRDRTEYYHGLVIYLLGALKFKDLDEIPGAKAVAFWGAAALLDLLNRPIKIDPSMNSQYPIPTPAQSNIPERVASSPPEPRNPEHVINIGGSVGGHINIGNNNIQQGDMYGGQVIMGPVQSYSPTYNSPKVGVSAAMLAELQPLFTNLKMRAKIQAPAEIRDVALVQLDSLAEAIAEPTPNLDKMASARSWFHQNLPIMAEKLKSFFSHPVVLKIIEAAGEGLVAEFRRRFLL
jgi:hypothetical protein